MDGTMMQKTLAERFDSLEEGYQDVLSTEQVSWTVSDVRQDWERNGRVRTFADVSSYRVLEDSYGKDSGFYNDLTHLQKGFYSTNYEILTKQLRP
ncbi:hypothetical protein KAM622c_16190 [Klebsiella quasipneumoniae subsp. quasipneumoniae]|nr:hypothetical protein KAM622c_16190 [Klebsiella quasipneumoniae subsp. quasipneumoniae]